MPFPFRCVSANTQPVAKKPAAAKAPAGEHKAAPKAEKKVFLPESFVAFACVACACCVSGQLCVVPLLLRWRVLA